MTVNISFHGFWPTFNPQNNFFKKAMQDYFGNEKIVVVDNHDLADYVIYSVFDSSNKLHNVKAKRIFFTGETTKRYPDNYFYIPGDIFIGFNETNLNTNTYRLPLWMIYIDWWSPEEVQKINDLTKIQDPSKTLNRQRACCIVASNPTRNRIEVAISLNENVFPVDGYGYVFQNPIPNDGETKNKDKRELLENYIFNICFENTNSVGYVTEKLFDAKFCGCIPIYWGDEWAKKDFNEDCFINYDDFSSHQEFLDYMKQLVSSSSALEEIASQPLFKKAPSLDGLYNFFDDIKLKG